jgi:putative PIN family toxin of toxin-antitoxin system
MNIVIDTNRFIAALIKEGITREIITNQKINLLFPEFVLEEIYEHAAEIIYKAGISEKEFYTLILRLLKNVRVIPIDMIYNFKEAAENIMGNIDKDDNIFIATALAFNCPIWSEDKHLLKQNKIKIFNTAELMRYIQETQ